MKQGKLDNYNQQRSTLMKGRTFSLGTWRKKIVKRDNHQCQHCFGEISDTVRHRWYPVQAHHIVARKDGGLNTLANGVALCKYCHQYFDQLYRRYNIDYCWHVATVSKKWRIQQIQRLIQSTYYGYLRRLAWRGE